jgi:hypothetical protein
MRRRPLLAITASGHRVPLPEAQDSTVLQLVREHQPLQAWDHRLARQPGLAPTLLPQPLHLLREDTMRPRPLHLHLHPEQTGTMTTHTHPPTLVRLRQEQDSETHLKTRLHHASPKAGTPNRSETIDLVVHLMLRLQVGQVQRVRRRRMEVEEAGSMRLLLLRVEGRSMWRTTTMIDRCCLAPWRIGETFARSETWAF